jgi:hypothetical protein
MTLSGLIGDASTAELTAGDSAAAIATNSIEDTVAANQHGKLGHRLDILTSLQNNSIREVDRMTL